MCLAECYKQTKPVCPWDICFSSKICLLLSRWYQLMQRREWRCLEKRTRKYSRLFC